MKTKPDTQLDTRWDASRLRAAVDAAKLDRFDLAVWLREQTGVKVNPETIRGWLVGKHEPPARMFVLLAERVGADARALLGLPTASRASPARGSAKRG